MTADQSAQVSEQALANARQRLTWLETIIHEDEGAVPAWVVAAKQAVDTERQRRADDAG
jgi:hypothetical protein